MRKKWAVSTAEFVWHGDHPDCEDRVRSECIEDLTDLSRAEDLVFHDIWLEDDPRGPAVLVWGKPNDKRLHCEYRSGGAS